MVLTKLFVSHGFVSGAKDTPVQNSLLFWNNGVFIEKHNRQMWVLFWIEWLLLPVHYTKSGTLLIHSFTSNISLHSVEPCSLKSFLRLCLSSRSATSPRYLTISPFIAFFPWIWFRCCPVLCKRLFIWAIKLCIIITRVKIGNCSVWCRWGIPGFCVLCGHIIRFYKFINP